MKQEDEQAGMEFPLSVQFIFSAQRTHTNLQKSIVIYVQYALKAIFVYVQIY